jgi:hypothetical protein
VTSPLRQFGKAKVKESLLDPFDQFTLACSHVAIAEELAFEHGSVRKWGAQGHVRTTVAYQAPAFPTGHDTGRFLIVTFLEGVL